MGWGTIIGLGVGVWISYSFILPSDVLNIKLAAMTIGDLLRIFGALVATVTAGGIGLLVGMIVKPD